MGFRQHWERRETVEPEIDEHGEYDRSDFYTFLVPVEGDIKDRLQEVQEDLSGFDCFRPVPEHWLHVTVKLAGFQVEDAAEDDEFDDLERVKEIAGNAVKGFQPFSADVKNLNLFPSAVFAEVHSRELEKLNQKFQFEELMPPDHDYLPHVTLGHFSSRGGFSSLVKELEKFRGEKFGELDVDGVVLARDDLNDSREKGFERVEKFPF